MPKATLSMSVDVKRYAHKLKSELHMETLHDAYIMLLTRGIKACETEGIIKPFCTNGRKRKSHAKETVNV